MRQRVFEGNKLVIASHNEGKIKEIRDLLKPLKIDVLSAKDFKMIEPDENGVSFEENALIKSSFVSKQSGLPSLSDDSGICFPDLNNSPGIYSARWAGKNKNFSLAMLKVYNGLKKLKNLLGLYIHWPYCESKCPYCDFNSHVNESIDIDLWIKSYTNQIYQMKEDIIEYNLNYDGLSSIFFGGGTPSLMPLEIIESILNISYKLFNFNRDIEISLEANPSSYEIEKFVDLKKLGINRLSVGVQSLNSKNLHFLGRLHNVNDVYNALDHATKTFDNVSVDLMYAFHGQDINLWIDELESFLKRYDLKHISLYQLTIEKGTKFFTDYKKGLIQLIDNDLAADFYTKTNMILSKYHFNRYEISNYSKINFECKHNLNYWNSDNWIGIGPGA